MADPWKCPYCAHTQPTYDAGAYYHRAYCEARAIRRDLDDAIAREAPESEIRKLTKRLEQAQYVGD